MVIKIRNKKKERKKEINKKKGREKGRGVWNCSDIYTFFQNDVY